MASPQNESQTHWADALPVYDRDGPADYPEEKPAENLRKSGPCSKHGPSQTPHLDAELRQPTTQAVLRSLIANLTEAVEGRRCTQCTVDSTANTLGAYMTAMKAKKKSGTWTREDKKVLKAEAKAVGKQVKASVKAAYRGRCRD